MTSSGRVITKILIDYDQYLTLKNYEKQIHELNAKKSDDLKIIKQKDDSFVEHEKKQEQTGSGIQLPEDFFEKLSTTITNQISQKFNLDALQQLLPVSSSSSSSIISQTGEGNFSNDLFPPAPSSTALDVSQPPAFDATNQKSQQYDKFDANKLISLIPQKFHKRAQILLNNIQDNPLEIDFNTKGELFIDGECIPNANIFKIFPQLYVSKVKKFLPGKDELVTKIASKGWGKLIVKGIVKGLKRPPKYKFHKDTLSSVKEFKNWWYLST